MNPSAEGAAVVTRDSFRAGPKIRVGFIVGPTGTGKSALAIEAAERLGAEIVNADSRLLYRGMDIGTAKPSLEERRRVTHHLIDILAPGEPIDVAGFRERARAAIAQVVARGRLVIVAGGSGLYLRVLRGGIFNGPPASAGIRAELTALAAERGTPHLHAQLRAADPEAAARIQVNDLYRIVRALEVFRMTGTPITTHQRRHGFDSAEYDTLTIGLSIARDRLYAAIDHRFDLMVAAGLVEEVRALIAVGHRFDTPPMRAIGYRQIAAYLRGELTLEAAIELAKRDTRRLAKRQLTWFRRDPEIAWVDALTGREQALSLLSGFLAPRAAGGQCQPQNADSNASSDE